MEDTEIHGQGKAKEDSRNLHTGSERNAEGVAEDCNSRRKKGIFEGSDVSGGKKEKAERNDHHKIDMKSDSRDINEGTERVCRICHSGGEASPGSSELIDLGCDCKAELGVSHLHCALIWFNQRGTRTCEICGKTANNVVGITEDMRIQMLQSHDMRLLVATYSSPTDASQRCKRSFCNLLLACLVIAFVLPWFLRINIF